MRAGEFEEYTTQIRQAEVTAIWYSIMDNNENSPMKNLFFISLVVFTWSLFQPSSLAQVPLEYNYHRIYHHENGWGGGTNLRISASPFDDYIISELSLGTQVDSSVMNISLHQDVEPVLLEGEGKHSVFRLHNPDDLTTAHQLYVHRPSESPGGIGSNIRYCEDFLSIEFVLDTAEYITLNGQATFENPIPEKRGRCLVFTDLDGNYLEHRCLMYLTEGSSGGDFVSAATYNLAGTMDSSVRIHDFRFSDSVEVVSSDTTYLLYSPTQGIVLSAETSEGISYSGTLDYTGQLSQSCAQAFENGVLRLFDIRGTADLNPTATTYNYSTPPGESHLILVSYDEYGQINYVNKLAIFDSMEESPGGYIARILRYNSAAVVSFSFRTLITDGAPVGVFSAVVEEDTVDTGTLFHTTFHGTTPQYLYVFESGSGDVTSVYSARYQTMGTEGFSFFTDQHFHTVYFGDGKFVFRGAHSLYYDDYTHFARLFPIEEDITLPVNQDTDHAIDYLLFPANPDEPEQFVRFGFNSMPPYTINSNLVKGNGSDVLFGGRVNGGGEMLFANNEWVPFSTVDYNYDCIFIHTSEMTVNVLEAKKAGFQVYPNPARGYLNISRQNEENAGYVIYSLAGSEIDRGHLHGRNETISVDKLHPGMYLLSITGRDGVPRSQKFIVQ